MVTDRQVRKLLKLLSCGMPLSRAALRTGMSEKTARRYLTLKKLPSELKVEHDWRTRRDPFEKVWPAVEEQLRLNPGLQAKTLFEWLQREHHGAFQDGQLRTLQRRIKQWRATTGPAKEVFFSQVHHLYCVSGNGTEYKLEWPVSRELERSVRRWATRARRL